MSAEKKGQTETLTYDFNTALESQVQLKNEKWYRVTCREFRSFNGPRRIIKKINNERVNEDYKGPIYYWNTNKIVKKTRGYGTQYLKNLKPQIVLRPHERHFLD